MLWHVSGVLAHEDAGASKRGDRRISSIEVGGTVNKGHSEPFRPCMNSNAIGSSVTSLSDPSQARAVSTTVSRGRGLGFRVRRQRREALVPRSNRVQHT